MHGSTPKHCLPQVLLTQASCACLGASVLDMRLAAMVLQFKYVMTFGIADIEPNMVMLILASLCCVWSAVSECCVGVVCLSPV